MLNTVHYIADDPGTAWVKDPQIAIDLDTPLDASRILTPNVVRWPGGGYRMYYTGLGPGRAVPDAQGYILSAFSEDGLIWSKDPGVRVDVHAPHASMRSLCPDVIPLPDGSWRMYYEARGPDCPTVVLSAISHDGIAWAPEAGVRVADAAWSLGSPRCIYIESPPHPGALRYRLYFHHYAHPMRSGLDAQNHILSAVSDDGLEFEVEPGIRIAQEDSQRESYSVYAPEVIRLADGTYRMYYSGWGENVRGGIFSAVSSDGLTWNKSRTPLLDLDRPLDCRMVSEPCVIQLEDGRCRMFYEAQDEAGQYRILSATARP